jgi:hypothetical protein
VCVSESSWRKLDLQAKPFGCGGEIDVVLRTP